MAELKPCPKCGSKDISYHKPWPFGATGWWASFHCRCGIEFNICTKDEQQAIDAWNKRS